MRPMADDAIIFNDDARYSHTFMHVGCQGQNVTGKSGTVNMSFSPIWIKHISVT